MLELHLTDIRTFKECRRRFFYSNVLRIRPKVEKESLSIGRYGHHLLAVIYGSDKELENIEISPENKELTESLIEMYKNEIDDSSYEVVQVELPMSHKINDEITILFTIDVVLKKNGKLYIMDHKFYAKTPNALLLELDEQLKGYFALAKANGLPIYGAILNCIVKKNFVQPEPLKSGKISKAQDTLNSTTYDLYLAAIQNNGLNIADYQDELQMLAERGAGIFHRFPAITKSPSELTVYMGQLNYVVDEIVNALDAYSNYKSTPAFYPCQSFICASCQYLELCRNHDNSSPENFQKLIDMDYEPKTEEER